MTGKAQRIALIVFLLLAGGLVVSFVVQCSRNWGRTRLVEVFDNGPMLPGPDGTPRMTPGPSEGFRWVGEHESPSPGKTWRTVNPADLTPEERQRIR